MALFFCAATEAQDHKKVKAEKSDGIYSLLKRHGLPPAQYMDEFIELNKSSLGKENFLIAGRTYKLPIASAGKKKKTLPYGSVVEELFGPDYKNVPIKDNQLKGAVFYLVSGHGGPDPGAIAYVNGNMLCEDEYAYDVTLRLARRLIEHSAQVYIIIRDKNDGIRDDSILKPDKDEVCYPNKEIPLNQLKRLTQRKDAVNDLHAKNKSKHQRLIVIHIDSRSKKKNIDVFFYHAKGSKTGQKLAQTLQQTFKAKYSRHQPNRGYEGTVSARELFMLKNTNPPSVFLELGNIRHAHDQQRFMLTDNRQALANWITEGLIKDFKNNKK